MPRIEYYDPEERDREKQASREADARALASGEKSREQLIRENALFPDLGVDWIAADLALPASLWRR